MSEFSQASIGFLSALKANNNKAWFDANRTTYEKAIKRPAASFASQLCNHLQEHTDLQHKAKIFRINRDIRFSKDKTPYNAHVHIALTPQRVNADPPAWLFALEPDKLTLGVGTFAFKGDALETWRTRVSGADGDKLAAILNSLQLDGARLSDPELKRVPAPFGADHPNADLLRHKGLAVWLDFDSPEPAFGAAGPAHCARQLVRLRSVFDWLMALSAAS